MLQILQEPGEALVSTVLFSNRSHVLYDRVNIRDIPPMTSAVSTHAARRTTAFFCQRKNTQPARMQSTPAFSSLSDMETVSRTSVS